MNDADVANFYNLPSAYPEDWPAELDESEPSDDEASGRDGSRARRSRYFALERSHSGKGMSLGSFTGSSSRENLAKIDEPDPLGTGDSVLKILKRRGLSLEDEARLRNRFLLSSTSFSPALFLSQAHSDASIESLLQGLDFLSRSIDQKSASLKVLVEANFERFVRAKATIDSVYTEMRNQGKAADVPFSPQNNRRSAGHFRSISGASRVASPGNVGPGKNALTKESDYGMKGIRVPLLEACVKAEEVWGPALGGREREQMLKSVVDAMEKHRDVYEIGGLLSRSIKQRDYDSIFEQYTKARTLAKKAKNIADQAASSGRPLTDDDTYAVLAMGRMWLEVDQQIQTFKRDLWRRLSDAPTTSTTITAAGTVEEHMELIGALLELGVEDNPIWVWLLSRYDYLKTKIAAFCGRCKMEIEILRRRLAAGEKPSPKAVASYLRLAPREDATDIQGVLDTDQVVELWECILAYFNRLLASQGGLLGEVFDFWEVAQSFINGTKQKLLPPGFEGESRKHHHLSESETKELQNGVVELVDLIRGSVLSLFADAPLDDASFLTSPISPATPNSPISRGVTPTESRFKLDPKNMPIPTPKCGEFWEDYAFWPPFSNSLSGLHYLSQFMIIIGTAASEMAALEPVANGGNTHDLLKALVSVARERSVRVACAAWGKDAEICKMLEDWTRDVERKDLTKMPGLFVAFENAILGGMQKILYVSEAMAKPGAVDVVTQPPAKLLQMVRTQFVSSVYKALSGLVENAEHPMVLEEDSEWILPSPSGELTGTDSNSAALVADAVDAHDRNVRILLTLSNIRALQADFVPHLITNFETAFSVKLTEEAKTIRDVLSQIDDRLFQSYTKPTVNKLNSMIVNGVTAPDWEPSNPRPDQVRPYVYNTLLAVVLVHTEISTTIPSCISQASNRPSSTAPSPLLTMVLTHLLTQISSSLLGAFGSRPSYTLAALMQATLDTEFIAQTLSQYSTDEASTVQSQIYVELDQRTTHEARARLQSELGEMRGILKRLRERTKGEFACFKKPRSGTGHKAA
ncbi:exocyst subunit SEC5 [Aspergillus clavatus NRRL 1]|uniref:Exocyst complex component SEC5 n=1 Tax=Aspergillus clavatus (strain ATCC 1007 / CBS 513.65 / DSM 816 / NCTC 3887 / NRRL 1 / QM 1276 / 107) TaxID=344612 RepID=A1CPI3_ASPCL|nr:Exocyst complex component Sec5, putative [Aspergillus clavatus NRRL 1]EAW07554.1 Exocyst complex component Sec5, putative [Aspergillus clavatus NRRL 1]